MIFYIIYLTQIITNECFFIDKWGYVWAQGTNYSGELGHTNNVTISTKIDQLSGIVAVLGCGTYIHNNTGKYNFTFFFK